MQIDSLICLENTKAVPLQKCETRRFSEGQPTPTPPHLYIPNSMEGRRLRWKWGINIPCVLCVGRLILHKDWQRISDILCHRNGEAFAFDLLYFKIIFRNGKGSREEKAEHLNLPFLQCSPNSPVSHKDQWQVLIKEAVSIAMSLYMYWNV